MRSSPHDSVVTPSLVSARGVTGSDADDALLVPALLVAVTTKVYAVPLVSPVKEHVNAPAVTHVRPPGDAVTV